MEYFLRVNMTELTVKEEEVPANLKNLGGRAVTSQVIAEEVPPTCHPLSIDNKIVIAPGILSGTRAPSSGRMSVGGKSPLTGGIKESNAGGVTSQKLAGLGAKAVIIEGMPGEKKLYALYIGKDKKELIEADEYKGLGTYELNQRLISRFGDNIGVICIGPAGEWLMSNAGVSTSDREGHPGRYAGRGGLGAVLGSKGIKAVVVDCDKISEARVEQPKAFAKLAKKYTKILTDHPISGALSRFGTAVLINILNEAGGLPTRNFKYGRFEQAHETSGEKIAEIIAERGGKGKAGHGCHPGCVIRCSNIYPDKDGEVLCAPVEYESTWALGPNLEIDNMDTVAKLNYLCNDIGLDTIETGVTLGVAMEAGIIPFGDGEGAIRLLKEEVAKGTPLGRVLGQGSAVTGKVYGVVRVPVVKGQGLPAYDPRAVKGIGVTYATSTMGADHTAGYSITANILKCGGSVDPLKTEGQVDLSRNLQIATAFIDSTGLCLFTAFAMLDNEEGIPTMLDLINAKEGINFTGDDLVKIGQNILSTERKFNEAAGFNKADDRLPYFMKKEKLPPHDVVFNVEDEELDKLFNF
ncbi:MAG: aldehyde ferredoxin oxidoreductase [Firmicutes bacterium HGW-Firmicutes-13]|nr:MAG: aldehyde ferredoxin oxidoreductase [Firmicutes bacterium HGW-Firmicutes-13]